MQQRQAATSGIRLKTRLIRMQQELGEKYEEELVKEDTVETPVATITGPLPVVKATREAVVQLSTTNPSILNFTAERQRRYLLACRETFLGSTYRLPDGVYEVDDVYYHPQDVSRVLGHLHMLYGGRS